MRNIVLLQLILLSLYYINNIQSFKFINHAFQQYKVKRLDANLGDRLKAEICEPYIGHSFIELKVKDDGHEVMTYMPTSNLSPSEILKLQIGSLINIRVTKISDGSIAQVQMDGSRSCNYLLRKLNLLAAKPEIDQTYLDFDTKLNAINLSNLTIGMKLEGKVVSCSGYAAFIDVNVIRMTPKSNIPVKVNGMLYHSDMTDDAILYTRKNIARDAENKLILEKGSMIPVYVRDVFKSAGRFRLTMDSTISKQKVVGMKSLHKQESKKRRQYRRIRRMLSHVKEGRNVYAVVDKLLPQGVLVNVINLGTLNISSIILLKDLPAQYRAPNYLSMEHRLQLLSGEFYKDRLIQCSVLKNLVNSPFVLKPHKSGKDALYNMDPSSNSNGDSNIFDSRRFDFIPSNHNNNKGSAGTVGMITDAKRHILESTPTRGGDMSADSEIHLQLLFDKFPSFSEYVSYNFKSVVQLHKIHDLSLQKNHSMRLEEELPNSRRSMIQLRTSSNNTYNLSSIYAELCTHTSDPVSGGILDYMKVEDFYNWTEITYLLSIGIIMVHDVDNAISSLKLPNSSLDSSLTYSEFLNLVDFITQLVESRTQISDHYNPDEYTEQDYGRGDLKNVDMKMKKKTSKNNNVVIDTDLDVEDDIENDLDEDEDEEDEEDEDVFNTKAENKHGFEINEDEESEYDKEDENNEDDFYAESEEEMDDKEFEERLTHIYQDIERKKKYVTVRDIIQLQGVQDMIHSDMITEDFVINAAKQIHVLREKQLTLEQFLGIIKLVTDATVCDDGDADDGDTNESSGLTSYDKEDDANCDSSDNDLNVMDDDSSTDSDVTMKAESVKLNSSMVQDVVVKKTKKSKSKNAKVGDMSNAKNGQTDVEQSKEDGEEESLKLRQVYMTLCQDNDKLSFERFLQWEKVKYLITLKDNEFLDEKIPMLLQTLSPKNDYLTFETFQRALHGINMLIADHAFQESKSMTANEDIDNEDDNEESEELFDDEDDGEDNSEDGDDGDDDDDDDGDDRGSGGVGGIGSSQRHNPSRGGVKGSNKQQAKQFFASERNINFRDYFKFGHHILNSYHKDSQDSQDSHDPDTRIVNLYSSSITPQNSANENILHAKIGRSIISPLYSRSVNADIATDPPLQHASDGNNDTAFSMAGNGTITIYEFLNQDDSIQESLLLGEVDVDMVSEMLEHVGVDISNENNTITEIQYINVMSLIDQMKNTSMDDITIDLYNDLKGDDMSLSVKKLFEWEDIQEMIDSRIVTKQEIQTILRQMGVSGKDARLSLEEFSNFLDSLESVSYDEDDEDDEDGEDGTEDIGDIGDSNEMASTDHQVLNKTQKKSPGTSKGMKNKFETDPHSRDTSLSSSRQSSGIPFTNYVEESSLSQSEDTNREYVSVDFEEPQDLKLSDLNDVIKAIYDSLRDGKLLSIQNFFEWESLQELIDGGMVTRERIELEISKMGVDAKKGLELSEFEALASTIFLNMTSSSEDSISDDNEDMVKQSIRSNERSKLQDSANVESSVNATQLFIKLQNDKKLVPVAAFKKSVYIQEYLESGLITEDLLQSILLYIGIESNKSLLTLEQFHEMINIIERAKGSNLVESIYDELKENEEILTVSTLLNWKELRKIVANGVVSEEVLHGMLRDLGVTDLQRGTVSFEIFEKLLDLLDDEKFAINPMETQKLPSENDVEDGSTVEVIEETEERFSDADSMALSNSNSPNMTVANQLSTFEAELLQRRRIREQTAFVSSQAQPIDIIDDSLHANTTYSQASTNTNSMSSSAVQTGSTEWVPSLEGDQEKRYRIFNILRGSMSTVPLAKARELLSRIYTEDSDAEHINKCILSVESKKNGALTFEQFDALLNRVEGLDEEFARNVEISKQSIRDLRPSFASGTGFDRSFTRSKETYSQERETSPHDKFLLAAKEVYDTLRGFNKFVSHDCLREWRDIQDLVNKKYLLMSSVERAIAKVQNNATISSCNVENEFNFEQFCEFISILSTKITNENKYDKEFFDGMRREELDRDKELFRNRNLAHEMNVLNDNTLAAKSGVRGQNVSTMVNRITESFNKLRGGRDFVTKEDIENWYEMKKLIELKALSGDILDDCFKKRYLLKKTNKFTLLDFQEFMQQLDVNINKDTLLKELQRKEDMLL